MEENTSTPSETTDVNVSAPSTMPEGGYSAKAEFSTNQGDPLDHNEFLSSLSEEYRDVESLKNVKDVNDLAKQYVNAQKLIGKKSVGVPGEGSTEEEVSAFYESLRPESSDKYEFNDEVLGEGYERSEEEANAIKNIFHEAGLSQHQARIIQEKYDKMMMDSNPILSQEEQEANFDKLGREVFGGDYDSVLEEAMSISEEVVPDNVKNLMQSADDNTLFLVASILSNVKSKYMNEAPAPMDGNAAAGTDRRLEAQKLMSHPAYNDPFHVEHDTVKKRLNNLYR